MAPSICERVKTAIFDENYQALPGFKEALGVSLVCLTDRFYSVKI